MAETANGAFLDMVRDIRALGRPRTSADPTSPARNPTVEGPPGRTYTIEDPYSNLVKDKSVDLRWAVANVLHFFAATEEADFLPRYNGRADKFLTDGRWVGAYGAIAVPQMHRCRSILSADPESRRAVVMMAGAEELDVNRPSCPSVYHFLRYKDRLHLLVYQRSLNVTGVMPYDAVLYTNMLLVMASWLGWMPGALHWTVGSLHMPASGHESSPRAVHKPSVVLPVTLLGSPVSCLTMLKDPFRMDYPPFTDWLRSGKEVRT